MPKKYKDATSGDISKDRLLLCNPYAHLDGEGELRALKQVSLMPADITNEIRLNRFVLENPYAFNQGDGFDALSIRKTGYTRLEIEKRVAVVHKLIWKNRHEIWEKPSENPVDLLDPIKAMELLGYSVSIQPSIGQMRVGGQFIDVAGIVDNDEREIKLSRNYKPEIQRFTAAHELGHILMHEQSGLHKDRPVDGIIKSKDQVEYQADVFASIFLMPKNLLTERFKKMFLCNTFNSLELHTHLFASKQKKVIEMSLTVRDFSRIVASCQSFNNRHFQSLSTQFKVSVETMAIRLEELGLVS